MQTATPYHRMFIAAAAIAGTVCLSSVDAQNLTAGDRYRVDLALSGMPIKLSYDQQVAVQAQLPSFENFTTPSQIYLNILADSGWQPNGSESGMAAVVDAFTTPGLGYLHALSNAGWNPLGGAGTTIDLKTPGERYLEMLAEAGWQPEGLQELTDMPIVVAR